MNEEGSFSFRGLEFHSRRMWQWGSVKRALELMKKLNLNALIFHQNDIIQNLVLPDEIYPYLSRVYPGSERVLSSYIPTTYYYNNRVYIERVINEAKRANIDFYLEVKEISFPDDIFELYPEVIKPDGSICPTNPFWWYYLDAKIRALFNALPDIAGIIVSPGTNETKVTIQGNTCKCKRCQITKPQEWYKKLVEVIYKPLSKGGKVLAVRDFTKTPQDQDLLLRTIVDFPNDVVIVLKYAQQDYYQTFPNNPKIGQVGNHPQWIEFDCWGQFYGIGFFPCSIVEDMQKRIKYCLSRGAEGIMLRTDWERLTEGSVFNSFNLVNVFGGAYLASDINIDLNIIYKKWLEYGLLSPLHSESEMKEPIPINSQKALENLRNFMQRSWYIMTKTLYVRGAPLTSSSCFPQTVDDAYKVINIKCTWDPNFSKLIEPTDENLKEILNEKEDALKEVSQLSEILKIEEIGLPEEIASELKIILQLYRLYVEGFQLSTKAIFLAKKALMTKSEDDIKATRNALSELLSFKEKISNALKDTSYVHLTYMLLDQNRIQDLVNNINYYLNNL
jgi:hypothetical protein